MSESEVNESRAATPPTAEAPTEISPTRPDLSLLKPSAPESGQVEKIVGVDRDLIEHVLALFRDVFHLATQANLLLELRTGISGINVAITNQRDSVTHLVTLLRVAEDGRDAQVKQVANLEEHLRRAFIEPYELALAAAQKRFDAALLAYKEGVLESSVRKQIVPAPPTLEQIQVRWAAINKKRATARLGKAENKHTEVWFKAAKAYVETFDEFEKLNFELEDLVVQARGLSATRKANYVTWISAIIGMLGSAILGWYLGVKFPPKSTLPPVPVTAPAR